MISIPTDAVVRHDPVVLLVGASRDERQMSALYLRLHQFRVVEIDNTADALALAPTSDVVVTDVRVPGPFDSVELVRRLRADDRTRCTPIIMMTGYACPEDYQRAHTARCDICLAKPCLPDMLLAAIRHVLAAWLGVGSPPPRDGGARKRRIA